MDGDDVKELGTFTLQDNDFGGFPRGEKMQPRSVLLDGHLVKSAVRACGS